MSTLGTTKAATLTATTEEASMSLPTIAVHDPLPGRRTREPITFTVPADLTGDLWRAQTSSGERVTCQVLKAQAVPGQTRLVAAVDLEGETTLTLLGRVDAANEGIRELPAREEDAVVRLHTGYFDLELCRGTAQGTGGSKWGLRHFGLAEDGIDLLPSGNNAIGGFYGPFFTPENGLINPPEHTIVDVEVVERGPIQHHYRMHGSIPDGLLPELRGKKFTIDWIFTYGSSHFTRIYNVDDFQAVINGRSVTNKITVGDEFESGPGEVVFDRFQALGGTRYRSGDPYAGELASMVEDTLATSQASSETFKRFRSALQGDIESAHWDLYWRLFCSWEGALPDDEIRQRLAQVRSQSHVLADLPDRAWIIDSEPVDVSAVEHQTIFAGPADKTVEFDSRSGRAMVWWTSQPSGAFQIVQRPQSGWVNWGTNGENECPELPVGVVIKTAFGPHADSWHEVALQMETGPRADAL